MPNYLSLTAPLIGSGGQYMSPEEQISHLRDWTHHVPAMARRMAPHDPREIEKSWRTMSRERASRGPKSAFFDPLSLQYALGYKDRRYSLTYDTLKRVSSQLAAIGAIINTRIAQISAFAQPYRITKSLGFSVRHKDPDHMTTASERRFIKQIEEFISSCGEPGRNNPFTRLKRPRFESFVKMIVRDSLTYDQCHPAGTMIELHDGKVRSIEEISRGDLVRTHTGEVHEVVETMQRRYSGDLIKIKSGSQILEATKEHPLLVMNNKWFRLSQYRNKNIKPEWVEAGSVTSDCYLVCPKSRDVMGIPAPKREKSSFIQDDEFFYVKVSSVSRTKVDDLPVFNFEVGKDHSYIANGFASHNCSFEIVPRNNRIPFEFRAVDASTIRIASPDRDVGLQSSFHQRNPLSDNAQITPYRFHNMYAGQRYGMSSVEPETAQYVQVINGQIENVYIGSELAFGVRNPRSDIYAQGYGFGEIEQLLTIITGLLYSESYNKNFFTKGSHPKGMLNFKGDNWTADQLESFKALWRAQVTGVENSWVTPITQSEGIEWINMQMSNQDMQFSVWIEYLLKLICAMFLIDPAEINFDLHGGVQQTPLFESSQEWKLKASRDRGLKPLLRFIANLINEHVVDPIDDHFCMEFLGLDELTEQEKHEMLKEQIGTYLTLNEGRRSLDLADLEGGIGDIPLNPNLIQLLQFLDQRQEREAQQQQQSQQEQQGDQEDQQDPTLQMKQEAHQQKMQQQAEKHPLEMQVLAQRAGVQLPQQGEEEQQEEQPRQTYSDLFGKGVHFDFDAWLDSVTGTDDDGKAG